MIRSAAQSKARSAPRSKGATKGYQVTPASCLAACLKTLGARSGYIRVTNHD
ncbi:hypothetical protein AAEZ42_05280 [Limosilactobacillus fermentum]